MYRASSTDIPGMSFRPFAQRLGSYQRATITIPTTTTQPSPFSAVYGNQPVSGGLGQMDLSTLTSSPLFWIAALGAGYFFFFRKR